MLSSWYVCKASKISILIKYTPGQIAEARSKKLHREAAARIVNAAVKSWLFNKRARDARMKRGGKFTAPPRFTRSRAILGIMKAKKTTFGVHKKSLVQSVRMWRREGVRHRAMRIAKQQHDPHTPIEIKVEEALEGLGALEVSINDRMGKIEKLLLEQQQLLRGHARQQQTNQHQEQPAVDL